MKPGKLLVCSHHIIIAFSLLCSTVLNASIVIPPIHTQPILRALVDARAPNEVREWIAQQTAPSWDFDRIITSHFESPISAGPTEYKAAFGYLDDQEYMTVERQASNATTSSRGKVNAKLPAIQCRDWELLDSINQVVAKSNAGAQATFDFQRGCI